MISSLCVLASIVGLRLPLSRSISNTDRSGRACPADAGHLISALNWRK
jgi:hypothetical protein